MEKEYLIGEDKLIKVLLSNKEKIGNKKVEGLDQIFAGLSFLVTILLATFKFEWLKYWFVILGAVYTGYGLKNVVTSIKNPYSYENLLNEIEALDQIKHRHSIVAIKNTWDEFPNKYLTYYDKKWGCDFFINYKTVDNMEDVIKEKVSNQLKIKTELISVEYRGRDIHRKYSVSNGKDKTYDHTFYLVRIEKFNANHLEKEFNIDGYSYKWLSIKEMRDDTHTYQINSDVIDKVDEIM